MNSAALYEKVVSGEMTPEQGADVLLRKPLPWPFPKQKIVIRRKWVYIGAVILICLVVAPIFIFMNRRDG
jgi:hypothetical protein